jgi:hypothetical protein
MLGRARVRASDPAHEARPTPTVGQLERRAQRWRVGNDDGGGAQRTGMPRHCATTELGVVGLSNQGGRVSDGAAHAASAAGD